MGREHAIGASRVDPLSVFLSYDRDDTQTAQGFVKALERQGFSIWWDGLISGGHAFADRIQQALADSDVIVVLWSESSSKSHWVRDEAGFGRDHGRLVPVSIDGTRAPLGFQQLQTIDLSGWNGSAAAAECDQLCRSIRSVTGASAPTGPSAVVAPRFSR